MQYHWKLLPRLHLQLNLSFGRAKGRGQLLPILKDAISLGYRCGWPSASVKEYGFVLSANYFLNIPTRLSWGNGCNVIIHLAGCHLWRIPLMLLFRCCSAVWFLQETWLLLSIVSMRVQEGRPRSLLEQENAPFCDCSTPCDHSMSVGQLKRNPLRDPFEAHSGNRSLALDIDNIVSIGAHLYLS